VPQDVYSCVASIVERERVKDAENGVNIAQQLDGFIHRKVIKQTVMTTVYGVTRFGARLQIARQLKGNYFAYCVALLADGGANLNFPPDLFLNYYD